MVKDENKKPMTLVDYLTCPTCGSDGFVSGHICPQCHGLGLGLWLGESLVMWLADLSITGIYTRRFFRFFKLVIDIIFFIFGLCGLFFIVLKTVNFFLPLVFFAQDNFLANIFFNFLAWLGLLMLTYAVYRLGVETEEKNMINPKRHRFFGSSYEVKREIENWSDLKKLNNQRIIDAFSSYGPRAKIAMEKAYIFAHHKLKQKTFKSTHLLGSLISFMEVREVLARLEINVESVKNKLSKHLNWSKGSPEEGRMSYSLKKSLIDAYFLALRDNRYQVDILDLFLSICQNDRAVADMFYDLKVDFNKLANVAVWVKFEKWLRKNHSHFKALSQFKPRDNMDRAMTASATPFLDRVSFNLTMLAKYGYFAPLVGREKEVDEILRVVQSASPSNVILVGELGVGKMAIIQGLARRMVLEEVPEALRDKRLMSLSASSLVGGSSPVEAQNRLITILNEISKAGNIILVIENIKDLAGITTGDQKSLDLLSILTEAMTAGRFICLATATVGDFSRYLDKDNRIKSAFQKININEPEKNTTIQILETKTGSIERHYQVYFSYGAIEKAASLSDRFIHEKFLPEKAIDILEEAAILVKEKKGRYAMVGEEEVAEVVSQVANVPVKKLAQDEGQKLLDLEEKIHERLVGQEDAVKMVSSALRRSRAGMHQNQRPIANLLFLGPTGVGKTELAKTIAEVYFGAEKNMIRLDMSEYQGSSSLKRLLGSVEEGGFLIEAVRQRPFSLLLLDEIEKADKNILNLFLQVMEDGRLTDNSGRVVDFSSCVIIATSNAGTEFIRSAMKSGQETESIRKELMDNQLKNYFSPEFINRFDGVIVFKPLDVGQVKAIAKLMIKKVAGDLSEKGVGLKISDQTIDELVVLGFDPSFGARPLRRVIQEKVTDVLADYILANKLNRRDTVVFHSLAEVEIKKAI